MFVLALFYFNDGQSRGLLWNTGPLNYWARAMRAKLIGSGECMPLEVASGAWSIPDRFAEICEQHRDRMALVTDEVVWTYEELASRVERVTAVLVGLGLMPGERIVLLFDQGPTVVCAMLAVLQARLVYIPLDPRCPVGLLRKMLVKLDAAAIIGSTNHLAVAREVSQVGTYIELTENGDVARVMEGRRLKSVLTAQLLCAEGAAYILYTSGSTGQPRGVIQSHRNVLLHIRNYSDALGVIPSDRLSLVSAPWFDAAVMDVYGALLNGASLCPIDLFGGNALVHLARWINHNRITIFHSTPTVFRHVVKTLRQDTDLDPLRLVVLGGELALRADFELYRTHFPKHCKFVNGYGPTECTIALQHILDRESSVVGPSIALGLPLSGVKVSLIAPALSHSDRGDVGEIALTAEQLALGYWCDPDRTKSAFLAGSNVSDSRTLLTGDMGRRCQDGTIQYVGRKDLRVKVRGKFVDVAEIESWLLAQPDIVECAVCVSSDSENFARLVAYVVPRPKAALDSRKMLRALSTVLPRDSLPNSIQFLSALPLTSTGKVDRKALSIAVSRQRPDTPVAVEKANPLEYQLYAIWRAVLKSHEFDITESFFDIGGDSLQAVEIVLRIEEVLGFVVDLSVFFENATIAGVARVLTKGIAPKRQDNTAKLLTLSRRNSAPLSLEQQRYWERIRATEYAIAFNVAIAIRLIGLLDTVALRRALQELVGRHDILRVRFIETRGGPRQVLRRAKQIPVLVHNLTHLGNQDLAREVKRLSRAIAQTRFNLAAGPPTCIALLQLADREHVLLLAQQHLTTDGASRVLIQRELGALYSAFHKGEPSPFSRPPVSYLDYAFRQSIELRRSPRYQADLRYWRIRLTDGHFPVAQLPRKAQVKSCTDQADMKRIVLSRPLSDRIRVLSRQHRVTLFMYLLASFKVLLFSYSGQSDIVVTTDSANRLRREFDETCGLFTNVLILRTTFRSDDTVGSLLTNVRSVVLESYDHQDIPFAAILNEIRPGDLARYDELFPASFHVETAVDQHLDSGVRMDTSELSNGHSSRDLLVTVEGSSPRLVVNFLYRRRSFDRTSVASMACRFVALLHAFVADPDRPIALVAADAASCDTNGQDQTRRYE